MDGFDDSIVTWFSFSLLSDLWISRKTFSSFLFLLRSAYLQVTCILVSSLLCGRRNLYQLSCRLVSTNSAGTWLRYWLPSYYYWYKSFNFLPLICITPVSTFFLIGCLLPVHDYITSFRSLLKCYCYIYPYICHI